MKEKIRLLLEESMQFNANDLLVNASGPHVFPVLHENQYSISNLKVVLKKAADTEKEHGVNPLCVSKGGIHWKLNAESAEERIVYSPLLFWSVKAMMDKVAGTVGFVVLDQEPFINPFVLSQLSANYGLHFDGTHEEIIPFLKSKGFFNIEEDSELIGCFHPHRFEQIRELEALLALEPSANISELLGDENSAEAPKIRLSNCNLFPADTDQLGVFEAVKNRNTVVQGPPGTGKSQVLSNLIAKLIHGGYSTVLVSEKRVALEVIARKLNDFDLRYLTYISDANASSKDFIQDLKLTWKKFEEEDVKEETNLMLSEQYLHRLQMQLELMNNASLFGGVDFSTYSKLLAKVNFDAIKYQSDTPSLKEFIDCRSTVDQIFQLKIQREVGAIKPSHFKNSTIKELESVTKEVLKELENLKGIFEINCFVDLEDAMRKAALAQLFSTNEFRNFAHLFDEKHRYKFLKAYRSWLTIENEISLHEKLNVQWIHAPSISEIDLLEKQHDISSFWKKRKFQKLWKQYSILPVEEASKLLLNRKNQLILVDKRLQLESKLLAMQAPIEAANLHSLYHQLLQVDAEKMKEWATISSDLKQKMANSNRELNSLYHRIKLYFSISPDQNLCEIFENISEKFSFIYSISKSLKEISPALSRLLSQCESVEEIELIVLKSTQLEFNAKFPNHANLSLRNFVSEANKILDLRAEEATHFAKKIKLQQQQRFEYYHELLRTPSTKLNDEQKNLKLRLKKGKAILVKEFAKSRNYPSLRELFVSDGRLWIQLLKPIWLCNPSQMARCFPMEKSIFDLAIFDEASQINLQNALGTVYRADRILVAGDGQQMGPTNYFKTQKSELIDVLHQAQYHWKNVPLHHHYRSEHPALIAFSNHYFYEGRLLTFPSALQQANPIQFHYCDNGVFEHRKNVEEAKNVAKIIQSKIDGTDKLGIVAFSETQLEEIELQLDAATREKLANRIECDTAFFKALENVQGDECDALIISLGYGKDAEGAFHLRFGPLNTKNGGKRLNVLLTRARKSIDFVASVKAADFEIGKNENVELLRKYLRYIEEKKFDQQLYFPFHLDFTMKGNTIEISNVYQKLHHAEQLLTLVNILQQRQWNVHFT
ncbi:MAG: AAA domain-containing protein [Bacteroidota bacterium]